MYSAHIHAGTVRREASCTCVVLVSCWIKATASLDCFSDVLWLGGKVVATITLSTCVLYVRKSNTVFGFVGTISGRGANLV